MIAWLRMLFENTRTRHRERRRPRTPCLFAEELEQRTLPSLITLASLYAAEGSAPYGDLLLDTHGNLFGTTTVGSPTGDGTVYEVKAGSGTITMLAAFSGGNGATPEAGVIMDSHGDLFGTTYSGGAFNKGTVFELASGSSTITTLASFNGANGANPIAGVILDSSGNLFGTTTGGGAASDGTAFKLQSGSNTITTLVSFSGSNGADPIGGLVEDKNGNLLGTTYQGGVSGDGTVFEIQAGSGNLLSLASFSGTNGMNPEDSLLEDSSGTLFGTTSSGGASGDGTIFKVTAGSGTITTLASFSGASGAGPQAGLIKDSSGNLFGTTYGGGGTSSSGTVFELPSGSNTIHALANFGAGSDGGHPVAGVVEDSSGNLFGAAEAYGQSQHGTVYEVQNGSSTITPLAWFPGANPYGGLTEDTSGNLFGTTAYGGTTGYGSVFEVQKGSSNATTLASFSGANGINPFGNLIADTGGNLFGTTINGGAFGYGTVFELANGSGTITALASFNEPFGAYSNADLVEDTSGDLFGTTYQGGALTNGTVFELPGGSHTITTLATFAYTNGANPVGGLVEDSKGNLFGTTANGGPAGDGTVFEVASGSRTIITLAAFNGTNGSDPTDTLLEDASGNLFGTTYNGGAFAAGTVFEVVKGSGTISTLASFNITNGESPYAGLVETASGYLVGTTEVGGAVGYGTVFAVRASGGPITTLVSFSGANGQYPIAGLIQDTSGNFFGATSYGGVSGDGTIFEWPAPIITTTGLPNATVNQTGYSQTLSASGGTGTLTFSSTGTLPPGLILSSGGVLSGTPTATGTYMFTVTAVDTIGESASKTYTVIVYPAFSQYLVKLAGSATVQAGSGFLVTVQAADKNGNPVNSYSGPLSVTPSVSPNGGASFPSTVSINSHGLGLFLVSAQKVGSYTIAVSSGPFSGTTAAVTVTPGPAVKLAFAAQPVSTPTGVALPAVSVQVLDLYGNLVSSDNSDTVVVSVATGAGGLTSSSTTAVTVTGGVAMFSNLILTVPGSYALGAVASTRYTGPDSASFSILPLEVVPDSFVGTPSGFSLQFNAPYLVNSVTPVLYGKGAVQTKLVPSVTLTQTKDAGGNPVNNPVEGSLVLDTAADGITFLATNTVNLTTYGNPLLADGTYRVDVTSTGAASGFQALNDGGGFLDGRGTGTPGSGDFTTTFTVNAAATHQDVVWVPATADGPGQALNAPGMNQLGGGFPIYLDDGTGMVSAVQATLNYDPTLLTVTGVSGSGVTLLGSSTPGHAVLKYQGPALPTGNQTPIGFLLATVPGGTAVNPTSYRAKDLLHLSNVSLNSGAIAVSANDGLHLVAYVADSDGNGKYSSNDAVLITQVALLADTGFAAYPLVDPVIVADTDGSGFVPADAALQANEAGNGFPTANLAAPPIPPGVVFQPVPNNVDPMLSVERVTCTVDRSVVTVAVNIDDADPAGSTGLTEGHLALTYDPHAYTVSAVDVHLGSVLSAGSGWSVVPTIDSLTGQIAIALSSTTPIISAQGGCLVTIDFHPTGVSSSASAACELVASVTPNGQYVATELEDAQGTFALSAAPSNGFDQRIDGLIRLTSFPVSRGRANDAGAS